MAANYVKIENGNPHFHLNPYNILEVAKAFTDRISKVDRLNSRIYKNNYDNFVTRWKQAIVLWEERSKSIKKMPVITVSDNFDYLINWLGLRSISKLEQKPGVLPSQIYLDQVLKNAKINPAEIIISAPYEDQKLVLWFYKKSKIKTVKLPYTVYADTKVNDLFDLYNITLNNLTSISEAK
jgi:zinc/manganese transport system substrate-binding protein